MQDAGLGGPCLAREIRLPLREPVSTLLEPACERRHVPFPHRLAENELRTTVYLQKDHAGLVARDFEERFACRAKTARKYGASSSIVRILDTAVLIAAIPIGTTTNAHPFA